MRRLVKGFMILCKALELKNQYCRVFYDKLTYIFIEMPLFKKKEKKKVLRKV